MALVGDPGRLFNIPRFAIDGLEIIILIKTLHTEIGCLNFFIKMLKIKK